MAVTLLELTQREIDSLGRAIIPLDDPDLSMFPYDTQQDILYAAIEELAGGLKGIAAKPNAERALHHYEKLTESWRIDEARRLLLERAEDCWNDETQNAIYAGLGEKEKLKEKAEEYFAPDWKIHSNTDLDRALKLLELAGETLDAEAPIELGLNYMLEGRNPWRFSQAMEVFDRVGKMPEIPEEKMPEFIKACDDEQSYYLSLSFSGDEKLEKFQGNFRRAISSLPQTAEYFLKLAGMAIEHECYAMASAYSIGAHRKKTDENAPKIHETVMKNASTLVERGYFELGRHILESIGQAFDREAAYRIFVESITQDNPKLHWVIANKMVSGLLLGASPDELKLYATDLHSKLEQPEGICKSGIAMAAYAAALEAYARLGDADKFFYLASKGIQSSLYEKMDFKKVKILEGRYDDLPESPACTANTAAEDVTHRHKEEHAQEKPTVEDILRKKNEFSSEVLSAYDKGGLQAVQELIVKYAADISGSQTLRLGDINPTNILTTAMFDAGRKPTGEDYVKFTRYALAHQLQYGIGFAAFSDTAENEELRRQISPAEWAMGAAALVAHLDNSDFLCYAIKAAEQSAKDSKLEVPPILYRLSAAQELTWASRAPHDPQDKWEHDTTNLYGANQEYMKVGDRGMLEFMDRNFGKMINR